MYRVLLILFLGVFFGLLGAYPTDNAIKLADRVVIVLGISWLAFTSIVVSICITGVKLANSTAAKALGNSRG